MRGLTGSEIVVLLAIHKKVMSFEEIDTLLNGPISEPHKTTSHWVLLLEDKRLIVRDSATEPIFRITEKGGYKVQEFLRIIEPYVPAAVVLM